MKHKTEWCAALIAATAPAQLALLVMMAGGHGDSDIAVKAVMVMENSAAIRGEVKPDAFFARVDCLLDKAPVKSHLEQAGWK